MFPRRPISRTAILVAALLGCFWAAIGIPILIGAYNYDFLCFYIGGTLAREGRFADLYKPAAHWQVQQQAAPGLKEPRPAPRPPWFSLALAPLTALPLARAYAVWVAIMLALLAASVRWGAARFGEPALLLAALSMPANLGICYGQDCAAMLALLCAWYVLDERRRDFAAGLVLGLTLMKFHLVLLIPLMLIAQKRWQMLAGFATTGAVLVGSAFAVLGVQGFSSYADYLLHGNTELLGNAPDAMINIYAVLVNFGISSRACNALLALAISAAVLLGVRRAPGWRAISIAATGSLLISPHVFAYDAAMLLLPIWLVIANAAQKPERWAALALAMPVTFFFVAVPPPWRAIPALTLVAFLAALLWGRFSVCSRLLESEHSTTNARQRDLASV